MQFLGSSKPQPVKASDSDRHSTRHTLLSLYSNAPSEDISLDEFERLALERLRGTFFTLDVHFVSMKHLLSLLHSSEGY